MPWIEGHGRPARAGRIAVFVLLAALVLVALHLLLATTAGAYPA